MTLASDQNLDLSKLSPTACRMLELRETVLAEWEKRLRAKVEHAANLPHPILINTFPVLYDNLAQVISPDHPRRIASEGNTIATEHGGERARLTSYSPQSVIAEYQLLRWTLLEVLGKHGIQLSQHEYQLINASIDESVRDAASAFAFAQAVMRERFVAALSHDLRNPLHISSMAAEALLRLDLPPQAKQLARKIVENNGRIERMVAEMLDCAAFQNDGRLNIKFANFDLLDVLREVCDETKMEHGCELQLIEKSVQGWWGRDELRRALENLLSNAVKYRAADTPIRVKIDALHQRTMITVHNEGEPIPPDQLESIFQVFRRTDGARSGNLQGWGIGLPYVRTVAESHGGSVGVDSATGRGTTFSIDIPIDARPFQNAPTLSEKT